MLESPMYARRSRTEAVEIRTHRPWMNRDNVYKAARHIWLRVGWGTDGLISLAQRVSDD